MGGGDGRACGVERSTVVPGRAGIAEGVAVRVKGAGMRWAQETARDELGIRQIRAAILFVCLFLNDSLVQ